MRVITKMMVRDTGLTCQCIDTATKKYANHEPLTQAMIDAFWAAFRTERQRRPKQPRLAPLDPDTVDRMGHIEIHADGRVLYAVYFKKQPKIYHLMPPHQMGNALRDALTVCPLCPYAFLCANEACVHLWDAHPFFLGLPVMSLEVPIRKRWLAMLRRSTPCDYQALMKKHGICYLAHLQPSDGHQRVYIRFADEQRITRHTLTNTLKEFNASARGSSILACGANDAIYRLVEPSLVKIGAVPRDSTQGRKCTAWRSSRFLISCSSQSELPDTKSQKRPASERLQRTAKRFACTKCAPECNDCEAM